MPRRPAPPKLPCTNKINTLKPQQVHSTSLVPAGEPESDVQPVLSGIVEPLLRACRLSADGLDPSDGAVFMLNNIDVVREALVAHAVRKGCCLLCCCCSLGGACFLRGCRSVGVV